MDDMNDHAPQPSSMVLNRCVARRKHSISVASQDDIHPTLNGFLATLFGFGQSIRNVIDAFALTAKSSAHGSYPPPATNDSCALTVRYQNSKTFLFILNQRSDAATVQVAFFLFNVSFIFPNLQLSLRITRTARVEFSPRLLPKAPGSALHQSGTTTPDHPTVRATWEPYTEPQTRGTNTSLDTPPSRPKPKPLGTGPHQSSSAVPNEPPPRPAPKPLGTGPHQS